MTKRSRTEHDSLGEVQVPINALYGAQTQRAVENFPVSGQRMPASFIRALILIKQAAAVSNGNLGCLEPSLAQAIDDACRALLLRDDLMSHFPVDVFQTGSGTSTNMNANEVIANIASSLLGVPVYANDHVNFGQSSNDVIPSAIHVSAAMQLHSHLLPALQHLFATIEAKAELEAHHCKTGRTHLMDAMPVTMGQTLSAWAAQVHQVCNTLIAAQPAIRTLAQGGTAVGTGINTHEKFPEEFCRQISANTGIPFTPAANFFAAIATQDTAVGLSGILKRCAVAFMKIANDLRWMNSGPLAGLSEIELPVLQPGSSIMAGKVNPVIPEAAAMVAAQVIGNDAAITMGGQSGNFELNVMLPMIASNLLSSLELLANIAMLMADKAIAGFKVKGEELLVSLNRNPVLVTALNPLIGYVRATEIARIAHTTKRSILDVALEHTDLSRETLESLLDPMRLTRGGLDIPT